MARPSAIPGVLLSHTISVRVDEESYVTWQQKVEDSKLTKSDFFRQSILKDKTVVIAKAVPPETKKYLVFIFSKASNNLNQIARRSHLDHAKGVLGEAAYESILAELSEIRRQLLEGITDADQS